MKIDSEISKRSGTQNKMCDLPQGIIDVLDCIPMREIEEYIDDRKGKQVKPLKRVARASLVLA